METPIRLKDILKVCEALEEAILHSIGPSGKLALVVDATGHLMLTSSGNEIIQKIGFTHPISKLIVNAVFSHHKITGDNSKVFIVLLTEIIRKIVAITEHKDVDHHHFIGLFSLFQTIVLPKVMEIMAERSEVVNNENSEKFFEFLLKIITGFFNGKFVKSISDCLSSLTLLLMKKFLVGTTDYSSVVSSISKYFDVICICAEGRPLSESFIVNGIVITRQYPDRKVFTNNIKFILMRCKLNDLGSLSATFKSATKENSLKALHWTEVYLGNVFDYYKTLGIELILSGESFSDVMVYMCHQRGIEVIQMVAEEEMDCMEDMYGILSVSNCFEELNSHYVKTAQFVKPISIGRSQYVLLGINGCSTNKFHTLVLNGPSFAFSKQYGNSIANCVKLLKTSLQNSYCKISATKKEINKCCVFPSGGILEFLFSRMFAQSTSQPHLKLVGDIVSDSLLSILQTLYNNSYYLKPKSFLVLQLAASNLLDNCDRIRSGDDSEIMPFVNFQTRDVLLSKHILINHLLALIVQLLKLDFVVAVKKPEKQIV